jgi:hypothetical protein
MRRIQAYVRNYPMPTWTIKPHSTTRRPGVIIKTACPARMQDIAIAPLVPLEGVIMLDEAVGEE